VRSDEIDNHFGATMIHLPCFFKIEASHSGTLT
jgi:hypothetical protein